MHKSRANVYATVIIAMLAAAALAALPAIPPSAFFVANEGQWDEPFAFKLSAGGTTYFVTEAGLTIDIRQYDRATKASQGRLPGRLDAMDPMGRDREAEPVSVRGHVLKMNFVNPLSPRSRGAARGLDKLDSYSNYFLGRDSCKWRSRVGHYQRVIVESVWQGIDVEFVADAQGVKTNYYVHPGADVAQIQIEYEGLDAPLRVDGSGDLVLATSLGDLQEQAPWAYQIDGRHQRDVGVQFAVLNANRYSVLASSVDANKELVIDPLLYGSYFGGEGPDYPTKITLGSDQSIFNGGISPADNFPTTPGAYEEDGPGNFAYGYVAKFSARGDSLVYSTYVGSHTTPRGSGTYQLVLTTDSQGRVWGGGGTSSLDWPVTPDAFDTVYNDPYFDGYFFRLSADGSTLEYCSYLGGSGDDAITYAFFDSTNQALWLCGEVALSPDFPVTDNALYSVAPGISNIFVGRFNTSSLEMAYLTYYGGDTYDLPRGILVSGSDSVWIFGQTESVLFPVTQNAVDTTVSMREGFVSLLNLHDNRVEYSSLIGGANHDDVGALSLKQPDCLVLAGKTRSGDYPLTPGAADSTFNVGDYNAFVTIISRSDGLMHSTLLSGQAWSDEALGVSVSSEYVTVVGQTANSDFPVTEDAEDGILNDVGNAGWNDLFIARLTLNLDHIDYATYLGGNQVEELRDVFFLDADTFWVTGETGSTDFPCSPNAFRSHGGDLGDVFIAKYAFPPSEALSERPSLLPADLGLVIYPNPFNSDAQITYDLSQSQSASLVIYDLLGRRIQSLDLGWQSGGSHRALLSFASEPSGIYTIRLQAGTQTAIQRAVLVR